MKRRTALTAVGTAMLTIGSGCVSEQSEETEMSDFDSVKRMENDGFNGPTAKRSIDREAGVVLYHDLQGNVETAIPIGDTNLE